MEEEQKSNQKHWGAMWRERGHGTIYSFFLKTVRGGCLITKGENAAVKEGRAFL